MRKEPLGINDDLPNTHLFRVEEVLEELIDIVQFLQEGKVPKGLSKKKNKILAIKEAPHTLINGSLYKIGQDDIL